jgi:hypothetical protein
MHASTKFRILHVSGSLLSTQILHVCKPKLSIVGKLELIFQEKTIIKKKTHTMELKERPHAPVESAKQVTAKLVPTYL